MNLPDHAESDYPSVEAAVSDYEENVKSILDRITEKFIKPHVPKEDDQDAMRIHVSSIIMHGGNWLTHEERKKGVRKFRKFLQMALDHRDSFSVSSIGPDGNGTMDFPFNDSFVGLLPKIPATCPSRKVRWIISGT